MEKRVWPNEIRLKSKEKNLEIDFDDGCTFVLPAEFLRAKSPSAEIRGHGGGPEKLVGGRRHVGILSVTPVGNYAIQISFDDLHDTGIYSWDYLYELGSCQEELWQAYLRRLEEEGVSRDP
ncbi:MAG: hypothetical protein COA65_00200 [Rhodospirillaceae bacterium]|nr:MAG: hypothetical protein COA65_00200 [Rhodospirillaceae bacterium]